MSDSLFSSGITEIANRLRRSPALQAAALASLPRDSQLGRISRAMMDAAAKGQLQAALDNAVCKPPFYAGDSPMLYDHFYTPALDSALRAGATPKAARDLANRKALSQLEDCVADHAYKIAEKRPLLLHVFRTERGRELAVAWAEVQEMGEDASPEALEMVSSAPEFNQRYAKAAAIAWYAAIMQSAAGHRGNS